ncbi:MAG: hypothetical protein H5T64_00385 [Chloroflexi bacterium]|nr:hypothetical protein [Chloroflexota bacterium]
MRFQTGIRKRIGVRAAQLALAVGLFLIPLLALPFAISEAHRGHWEQLGLSKSLVRQIVVASGVMPTIYAVAEGQGVFRSTDNGMTWTPVNSGLPADYMGRLGVQCIAVDPHNPQVLFVGLDTVGRNISSLSASLYRSTDGGMSWQGLGRDLGGEEVRAIGIAPPMATITTTWVYAAVGAGLYVSADSGNSWTRLDWRGGEVRIPITTILVAPGNVQVVYVGTAGGGVYKSVDGGLTWTAANKGIETAHVLALAMSPGTGDILYAGTTLGLFSSTDEGASWQRQGERLGEQAVYAVAVHPLDEKIVYIGLDGSGVLCSTDGGHTWAPAKRGLGHARVFALTIDPLLPSAIYAGTRDGVWCYVGTE